jgi:glycosyltransferase involved in cell wall biosynthesis
MKIGIDIRELTIGNTGISQYTGNLIKYLVNNDFKNHYFLITNKKFKHKGDLPLNFKVIEEYTGKPNLYFEWFGINNIVKKFGINIFVSPYYKKPVLLNIPVITTVHDIGFITFPSEYYCRSDFYRFFAKYYLKYSLKYSSGIISVSEYTKKEILKYSNINPEKILVLNNTINPVFNDSLSIKYQDITKQIKKDFGRYILSVCNFKPHKNIKTLISAFSSLKNKTELNLVLAGPENKWQKIIKEYTVKCELGNRIRFVTPENNVELALFYSNADMLVHPSLHEGFGLPPIEAQSCGCPVISSPDTSLKEVLKDSALFFNAKSVYDLKNKILQLEFDTKLKNILIQKGYANVMRFKPDYVYPKFLNFLSRFDNDKN